MTFYEATINGKEVTAATGHRLHPDHGCGTFTPYIEFQSRDSERIRAEISSPQTFLGNCIGGDECEKYLDEVLVGLGFVKVPEPEPVKCPHCGATS